LIGEKGTHDKRFWQEPSNDSNVVQIENSRPGGICEGRRVAVPSDEKIYPSEGSSQYFAGRVCEQCYGWIPVVNFQPSLNPTQMVELQESCCTNASLDYTNATKDYATKHRNAL
jgi:hypothetical protein